MNTGAGWKLLRDSAYAPIVHHHAPTMGELLRRGARRGGRRRALSVGMGARRTTRTMRLEPVRAIVGDVVQLHAMPGRGGYGDVSGWQLEPRDIPPMEETLQRLARVRRATGVATEARFCAAAGDLVVPRTHDSRCCSTRRTRRTRTRCSRRAAARAARSR